MADPLSLKLIGIPTHLTQTVEVVTEGGIYFGSNYTFTATTEAGRHILIAAVAQMLADVPRAELETFLYGMAVSAAPLFPMIGDTDA